MRYTLGSGLPFSLARGAVGGMAYELATHFMRGARLGTGAIDLEALREARRQQFTWRGLPHSAADEMSSRASTVATLAGQGNISRAEAALADSEAFVARSFAGGSAEWTEAQRLLGMARDILVSYGGDATLGTGATTGQQQAAAQEATRADIAASAGETQEAWAAEQEERQDAALAAQYGSAAYGVSWIPGGNVVVEGTAAAVDGVGAFWDWIPWWAKLAAAGGIGIFALSKGAKFAGALRRKNPRARRNPILLVNPPRRSRRNHWGVPLATIGPTAFAAGYYARRRNPSSPDLAGAKSLRAVPAHVRRSPAFRKAAAAFRERYGVDPDCALPVSTPKGTAPALTGIGPMVEGKYLARDNVNDDVTEWFHPAGERADGTTSRAAWWAHDPIQDRVIFAEPPGAAMRFRRAGIEG